MPQSNGPTDDELLAYLRGETTPEQTAHIEKAASTDDGLRAELALMSGLKPALAAASDGPDARTFGWKKLEAEISRTAQVAPVPRQGLWRVAAVLLGALVVGQGAYIALAPSAEAPAYRTVSEDSVAFGLGVGFVATAKIGEVQTLLRETGARIVDGPGSLGIYRLAFETEAARAKARELLQLSPLVDLVAED
ncbi:hypothetical protein PXK01_11940 [Phaeobacter sp. PT47_59]|uniref:hypothetical protein n=1 Tax=Phaeobacter sp. PT47_59 TaxID=3029979 RepID=UPI0023804F42|nr:hypothetical protein [Phaeobacter sp. PT47_59]MDE4174868.1 hypothetical protein [Phaeobacter sp. PT47_59]